MESRNQLPLITVILTFANVRAPEVKWGGEDFEGKSERGARERSKGEGEKWREQSGEEEREWEQE